MRMERDQELKTVIILIGYQGKGEPNHQRYILSWNDCEKRNPNRNMKTVL